MKKLHPKDPPNDKIKGRHKDRLKQSVEFMLENNNVFTVDDFVLTIGEKNVFDQEVIKRVEPFFLYAHTEGDLDTDDWTPYHPVKSVRYDIVLCFEVLEHLANPLLFLRTLKRYLSPTAYVFISIPNHLLRRHWRTLHYHEIDPVRFEFLCEQAGYEIMFHKVHRYWPRLRDISGIKPFLRYISGYSWFISRVDRHFYMIAPNEGCRYSNKI